MSAPATRAAAPRRPGVAVVVGSGGVKCAAALGLVRVLERESIPVDMVVGCSAGTIFATALASQMPSETAVKVLKKLWTREITSRPNRRAIASLLFPRLFGFDARFGLRNDGPVLDRLNDAFGDRRIESLPIPLHVAATDFATGNQKVFSQGRIVDAIRASLAVPFVFSPWEIDGRLYADGFLSDPLPVGVAIREGAHLIVAMGFESPYQDPIHTGARFAFQVSSILSNNLLKAQFAFHGLAHHAEVVPIVPTFRQRIRLFDVGKIEAIIEDGEQATEAQLPYIRRVLAAMQVGDTRAA